MTGAPAIVEPSFDHVALACPDLSAARRELQEKLGVVFDDGGQFPADDSQNAIAAIRKGAYVGLIGPMPEPRPGSQGGELQRLTHVQPYSLVYASSDLLRLQRSLASAGFRSIIELRERGDTRGEQVRMHRLRLISSHNVPAPRNRPMFIDWLDSAHPSQGAARRIDEVSITVRDPMSDSLERLFEAARVLSPPEILKADHSELKLTIKAGARSFTTSATFDREAAAS